MGLDLQGGPARPGRRTGRSHRHVVDGEHPFAAEVAAEGEPPAQHRSDPVAVAGEEADVDEQRYTASWMPPTRNQAVTRAREPGLLEG
jgi:hypothetical protein